jgi:hypothetical protein
MSRRAFGRVIVGGAFLLTGACARASLAPPTVDVTGSWVGTWRYDDLQMGSGDLTGTFQQSGQQLTGEFSVTGPVVNRRASISGAVSGNEIMLGTPASGRLTVNGDQITGTINGLNPARVTLRKQ